MTEVAFPVFPGAAPAVSVLMPVRDAAPTVGVALRSVLRSRGLGASALEVICVDHRSRDDSPNILRRFAQPSSSRVTIVDGGEAGSLAQALELGRARCRAPLIARMDADDVMHPDRLAADLAHLAPRPRLGAVACRARVVPKHRARPGLRAYLAWQNACMTAEEHAREIFVEQPLLHPATTFRASVLAAVGGWRDVDGPEDYDLFLRIAAARIDVEKRPAVHHSWRQHSATSTRFDRDALARMKARALIERFALAGSDVVIAGAGKEGARIARALAHHGVRPHAFVDVAPKRIGRLRHGVPVLDARELPGLRTREMCFVVAAVGTSGARGVVRAQLERAGFAELVDCVVVA